MSSPLPPLNGSGVPIHVRDDMQALRDALDAQIPQKRNTLPNLLIATWNIREFGSLTERWTVPRTSNLSPKRDWRGLWAIIEIISRFDVVAVQEVTGDLRALRTLLKTLGDHWQVILTDVTAGADAGAERLAFIFDSRRVQLSGLACELVVPREWLEEGVSENALRQQFARTPYAVGFRSGHQTFVLVTLHVDYGSSSTDRVPELRTIARWMADWARRTTQWEQNFLVLGDFNIDRRGDPLYDAFTSTGLVPAPPHVDLPRTIFSDDEPGPKDKYYDQIAWFTDAERALINMGLRGGSTFDFRPHCYTELGLTRSQLSFRLSDHFPLWIEFELEGDAPPS